MSRSAGHASNTFDSLFEEFEIAPILFVSHLSNVPIIVAEAEKGANIHWPMEKPYYTALVSRSNLRATDHMHVDSLELTPSACNCKTR